MTRLLSWCSSKPFSEVISTGSPESRGVNDSDCAKAPAAAAMPAAGGGRAGFAGLFGAGYLLPTLVMGLMSATALMLVYSLNTWLPELMLPAEVMQVPELPLLGTGKTDYPSVQKLVTERAPAA